MNISLVIISYVQCMEHYTKMKISHNDFIHENFIYEIVGCFIYEILYSYMTYYFIYEIVPYMKVHSRYISYNEIILCMKLFQFHITIS
jgi:hypothetical protein